MRVTRFSRHIRANIPRRAAYYVDATGGNDSNNGRSPSSAWKTIAKINATVFNLGAWILLKQGEVWRETLIVPANNLTFGAYGSGVVPIVKGSDQFIAWIACPAIDFGDNFEDGTINAWAPTTSNGTVAASNEQAFEGTYSAKCVTTVNGGTAYIQKATAINVGTGGHIWLTGRFYAHAGFAGNNTVFFMSLMETGGSYVSIKCGITATGAFYVYNGVSTDDWTSTETYTPDTWFTARLYVYAHDANGIIRLFIDDTKVIEATGIDTLSGTNWRRFIVGIIGAANDTPTLYVDYCRANGTVYDPSFPLGYYKAGVTTQPNDAFWNETTRLVGNSLADGTITHSPHHLYEGTARMGYDPDNDICYIRAPGDADPSTGMVELGQRDNCLYHNNKTGCRIISISVRHANDLDSGGLRIVGVGGSHIITNVDGSYCQDSGIMIQGSSTGNVINGGTFNNNARHCVQFYQSDNNIINGAIVGGGLVPTLGAIYVRESDDCEVEYCTVNSTLGFGIDANTSNRPHIHHNNLTDTSMGIWIEGTCADYLIENNIVTDASNPSNANDGGINVSPTVAGIANGIIRDNVVDDCENGIQLSRNLADDAEVYRNLIKNTKAGSAQGDIWLAKCDDVHIYNNTCVNGGGDGIKFSGWDGDRSSGCLVKNNIIYNPVDYCVNVDQDTVDNGVGNVIDYNCYWKAGVDPDMWKWGNTVYKKSEFAAYQLVSGQDAHSIVADPLFVNPIDFHLQTGSPCINAGVDVGLPYLGIKPDMGYAEKE